MAALLQNARVTSSAFHTPLANFATISVAYESVISRSCSERSPDLAGKPVTSRTSWPGSLLVGTRHSKGISSMTFCCAFFAISFHCSVVEPILKVYEREQSCNSANAAVRGTRRRNGKYDMQRMTYDEDDMPSCSRAVGRGDRRRCSGGEDGEGRVGTNCPIECRCRVVRHVISI